MKIVSEKRMKIKLSGEDITSFKSAMKKISSDEKSAGFSRFKLDEEESKAIQKLSDKIN